MERGITYRGIFHDRARQNPLCPVRLRPQLARPAAVHRGANYLHGRVGAVLGLSDGGNMNKTLRQRSEVERHNYRPVDNYVGLIAALVGVAIIIIAIMENT